MRKLPERGFVVYDIVGGFNRDSDGALVLVDLVFLRGGRVLSTSA